MMVQIVAKLPRLVKFAVSEERLGLIDTALPEPSLCLTESLERTADFEKVLFEMIPVENFPPLSGRPDRLKNIPDSIMPIP